MKNRQSFYTTFLMSLVMLIWYNTFFLIIREQTDFVQQGNVALILLQVIMAIKCISSSVVVMPTEPRLMQIIAGYVSADMLFGFPLLWNSHFYLFPPEMVISQAVLAVIYIVSERRLSTKPKASEWDTSGALIFQGI